MVTVEAEVQLVYWPVIVTLRAVVFGFPKLGLTCVMTGVPAVTLKAPDKVIGVPLVVTVTSRLPTLALEATVMLAVSCVRVTPEIKFTLTPEPKLTVEKPAWKVVNSPTMTTLAVVPAWAKFGVAESSCGTPASTLKPPVIEAVSPPVTTVTLREAIIAVWLMLITATACVASLAVVERTLIPAPKLATLQLGAQPPALLKCVNWPVSVTLRLFAPWVPVGGLTLERYGLPTVTVKAPSWVATSPPVVNETL